MHFWREIAFLVAIGFVCAVTGAAASLLASSTSLGTAVVSVPRCTTAGLSVVQTLSGANVASVTISGLPNACGNATAQAGVHNGTTSGNGSATVPAAGGAVTVTLGVAPAAGTVEQIDVILTGP
jgi:hypothetical protein